MRAAADTLAIEDTHDDTALAIVDATRDARALETIVTMETAHRLSLKKGSELRRIDDRQRCSAESHGWSSFRLQWTCRERTDEGWHQPARKATRVNKEARAATQFISHRGRCPL